MRAQVLDDSTMLCLPSTERVKLDPHTVRLIVEAQDLAGATPSLIGRLACVQLPMLEADWR